MDGNSYLSQAAKQELLLTSGEAQTSFNFYFVHTLEWISYSEVQTLRVLKMIEVVESILVGHVYAYAPVEAQNKEVHIIAYAYTGTKSCPLKYVLQAKLRACAVAIIAQSPYVACIKEECTI